MAIISLFKKLFFIYIILKTEAFELTNLLSILSGLYPNFIAALLLISIALTLRLILELAGQHWVKTFAQTATLVLLPLITYVVTKVISGNIALSLGMVGALSIVRFRNPVKSPFELSVYFFSISTGITASVSLKWTVFLVLAIALGIFALMTINFVSRYLFKNPYFLTSFSEGNSLATLEVTSLTSIPKLEENEFLMSFSKTETEYCYVLTSSEPSKLKNFSIEISNNKDIIGLQFNG